MRAQPPLRGRLQAALRGCPHLERGVGGSQPGDGAIPERGEAMRQGGPLPQGVRLCQRGCDNAGATYATPSGLGLVGFKRVLAVENPGAIEM